MTTTFKSFIGNVPVKQIQEIFETEIVTDNISTIDGSTTFLNGVDIMGNLDMTGNDIINVETLGVTTVNSITTNASSVFTGDITVSGSLFGNGAKINIEDDLDATGFDLTANNATLATKLLITDTPGFSSNTSQIHIQDLQNASIFLEADTNNVTETDISFIMFSQDGNNTAMNITGGDNVYSIIASTNAGSRGLNLSLGTTVDNGQGVLPTINAITPKVQIRDTLTTFTQDSSFSQTDLLAIDNLELFTISANTSLSSTIDITDTTRFLSGSELVLLNRTVDTTPDYVLGLSTNATTIRDFNDFDIFGRFYQTATSTAVTSSASSVSYTLKVQLVTPVIEAGTYFVAFSCLTTNSNATANQTELQFTEDAVALTTPTAFYSNTNGVNEQFSPSGMFFTRTLTAASHTYNLNFRPTGGTSRISDARILFYRLS